MAETNINAYRAEAIDAQVRLSVAQGDYDRAVEAFVNKGGDPAEFSEAPIDEPVPAEVTSSKPLSKMNRAELDAKATEAGVEKPEDLATNQDVIDAIKAKDSTATNEETK